MKKILIILSQDLYIRNYLTHDNFKLLEQKFDCNYISSNQIKIFKKKILKKKNFLGFVNSHLKSDYFHRVLVDAYLILNRKKSPTFILRMIMRFNLNFKNVIRKPYWKVPLRISFRILMATKILIPRIIMSIIIKNKFFLYKLINYIYGNPFLEEKINKINPDLILMPTSGIDEFFFNCLNITQKNKKKFFAIIDNWDNLTSKSIMFIKPDYIGTWGEQTKKHAIEVQNFKPDQCKILGSSRYEEYFRLRNEPIKSYFDFEYILFLGTSWYWNEEEVLLIIDKLISENFFTKKFKLIYRPHPWRQSKKKNIIKFDNIIYDPQIIKIINKETHNHPDLDYYPALIKNSLFVMGGPQSMMIESIIFNKFYLSLIHDDKINFTNMKKVFTNYLHFRGVEKIDNIFYCDNIPEIKYKISNILSKNIENIEKTDKQRNYILHHGKKTYKQTLLDAVTEILN